MSRFKPGDKVIVNSLHAIIESWDEAANVFRFVHVPHGGGSDTVTAHISNTRVEPAEPQAAVEEPAAEAPAVEPVVEAEPTGK